MSNKKNLLNEATIRRFMSLANMQPLSENFLDNVDESDDETVEEGTESEETVEEGTETEETVEEEIDLNLDEEAPMDEPAIDDLGGEDMGPEEPGLEGDEAPMADMPAEEGAEVTLDGDQVASVRAALEDALALVGELGGDEAPMDDELPMDGELPPEEAPLEDEEGGEEDLALEFLDDDAVVQEVFKRVVSRIAKKD